jgi:hypothetical protein
VDSEILWRVALVQVVAVAVVSLLLGLALPHSFFEDWGWLTGPLAWMLCALLTARVVGLPDAPVLVRAALSGIPSLLFVLLGLHWLGAAVAVAIFALWCATLPRPAGRHSVQSRR